MKTTKMKYSRYSDVSYGTMKDSPLIKNIVANNEIKATNHKVTFRCTGGEKYIKVYYIRLDNTVLWGVELYGNSIEKDIKYYGSEKAVTSILHLEAFRGANEFIFAGDLLKEKNDKTRIS